MTHEYTNFCARSGGSSLNAGTRTGNNTVPGTAADLTYASGSWVQSTRVFTVASGNPITDGVAVGDYASVYANGASTGVFWGRITARDATTITISGSAKVGTAPTDGTSNRTLKIGGAWPLPNGATAFPFNIGDLGGPVNATGRPVRVNLMNDADLAPTAAWTIASNNTPIVTWQGFNAAYGDGGVVVATGPSSGASFDVLSVGQNNILIDMDFNKNGSTGSQYGLNCTNASANSYIRVSCRGMTGRGALFGEYQRVTECQFDSNGSDGVLQSGGVPVFTQCSFTRNGGSGINPNSLACNLTNCLVANNVNNGIGASTPHIRLKNCDFYNNNTGNGGQGGVYLGNNGFAYIDSCNFVKNTQYGIYIQGESCSVFLINCGFGTGSQANTTADYSTVGAIQETGTINYASGVTPWSDPANGNFTTTLAAAKNTGNGVFLNRASGYGGTLSSPDVGASTHAAVVPGALMRSAGTNGGVNS